MQLRQGDLDPALASFREGLKIRQTLADADPSNVLVQGYLLASFQRVGTVAQRRDDFASAIAWYEKALDVARRFPRPEAFAPDVRALERRIRACRGAEKVLNDPAALRGIADADRPAVLNAAIGAHVRRKTPDKAIVLSDQLAAGAKRPDQFYDAARGYALSVPLVEKAEVKERYAARAVVLLKQAVAKGYKDATHMKTDADLAAVRGRDDFKELLKEMEAKPSAPPEKTVRREAVPDGM